MLKVTVFLAVLAVANAGFFDGVDGITSDAGNFFSGTFKSVKDLFGNDQKSLETNIGRVKDLLVGVKDKIKMLEPLANDSQKQTLRNVDSFLGQITGFQKNVVDGGQAAFNENKSKWQDMVTNIFDKGGLTSVLKLLNLNSASSYSCAAIVAPIFYFLFVR
ncbi:unnamed protein product [Caenorhabditis angaria]|uniref:SXP/RAL-2 family protein Ani s 5-like cation-binding domain-containing protein n=1 Tax=Caenorhabditis angaria TaxID=860376 RepID=A0A9P1N2F5_9PELO|nr:unnamed protein product [Caenorhabditis angaria]